MPHIESKIILGLRHCAQCGHIFGLIDLFCELCWDTLIDEMKPHWRTEGAGFPVFCLWAWGDSSSDQLPRMLKLLKGGRHLAASKRLATLLALNLKKILSTSNGVVTSVPNSTVTLDHSQRLACALAEVTHLSFQFCGYQKRSFAHQKTKSKKERRKIEFQRTRQSHLNVPDGGTLFIVDDVVTTGATLKALREHFDSRRSVVGLCLVNRLC